MYSHVRMGVRKSWLERHKENAPYLHLRELRAREGGNTRKASSRQRGRALAPPVTLPSMILCPEQSCPQVGGGEGWHSHVKGSVLYRNTHLKFSFPKSGVFEPLYQSDGQVFAIIPFPPGC